MSGKPLKLLAQSNAFERHSKNGQGVFFKAFLADPAIVGSIVPSSKHLARALLAPFRCRTAPAKVLEIGAGTGVITRWIARGLGPQDELDVCERQPALANHLESKVFSEPFLAPAVHAGRVRLLECAVQDIEPTRRYDHIVCGLPFTAFCPEEVESILELVRAVLVPNGTFSYFEYVALRRFRLAMAMGPARQRIRRVSAILDDHINRFQVGRRTVLANFPPAYARYWKFDQA